MIVSSRLFEAYIECTTKCWLRSRAEPAAGNIYAEWVRAQNEAYRQDALKKLLASLPEGGHAIAPPISKNSKNTTWRIAVDVRLQTNELESHLHAVERIAAHRQSPSPHQLRKRTRSQGPFLSQHYPVRRPGQYHPVYSLSF